MLIDRELERRAYMFYESIDNYINKHIVSDEQVKIELINILKYVIGRDKIMINPKYEIGYRFKDSKDNEYEILARQLNGDIFLYDVIDLNTGFIKFLTGDGIDIILGGANAKKSRKKQTRSLL